MRQLLMDVQILCRRNKTGSFATRANRETNLKTLLQPLAARHPDLRAANLQARHVGEVVKTICVGFSKQTGRPLSVGRQKNLLASLRWLLEQLGKSNLLPRDNERLGVERRQYVPLVSKAISVTDQLIAAIASQNERVAVSLLLCREFGLRFEESLKFRPASADCRNEIHLQGSWTKGNVPRRIPILTANQQTALDRAQAVAGDGSLIPDGIRYDVHRNFARRLLGAFGVNHIHGARHSYAQRRYVELTGFECTVLGGPRKSDMTPEQQAIDRAARLTISNELGHGRRAVTNAYLGSVSARYATAQIRAYETADLRGSHNTDIGSENQDD